MSFPDPVFGHIRVTDFERTVIDLPEFQRLKRIKQLGVASIVFSGAQHSRFEHSLGTMNVAELIFDRFKEDFDETDHQKLRMAALLHDIGHAPFSHTFEIALKRFNLDIKFLHEENTKIICNNISKKYQNLSRYTKGNNKYFDTIGKIATGEKKTLNEKEKFLSSIISGEIDADRIDYLIRDGLHTGVNFIGFKLSLLLENISKNDERFDLIIGKPNVYRAFHEKIAIALGEAFLISRYHYYEYLINHPRNISANLMIIKSFENALMNVKKNQKLFKEEIEKFFNIYDDQDFLNFIDIFGDPSAKNIVADYKSGQIFKHIFDLKSKAIEPKIRYCLEIISQRPFLLDKIEDDINQLTKDNILLFNSSVKGIPKNLRVRVLNDDRFLYDESRLASSLISEILSSNSLYLFVKKENTKTSEFIYKNWNKIQDIFFENVNQERLRDGIRIDFLLLLINEFYLFLWKKEKETEETGHTKILFISTVYKMVKWIQDNYPKKYKVIPLNYKFNNDYGFLYSPELFEEIMKLTSLRFIKTEINEKENEITRYNIKKGKHAPDYFENRSHIYYSFYMLLDGAYLSKSLKELYPEYIRFIQNNMDQFHSFMQN